MRPAEILSHSFPPFWNQDSELLILGSFPSVKSREQAFYYGHPQNRFWRVLASVYGEKTPLDIDEKKAFLSKNRIALWDVIERCEISGSSDASIRSVVPTDLYWIIGICPIKRIILNGRTAEKYFRKYFPAFPVESFVVPSTSPANARIQVEKLTEIWKKTAVL